MKSSQTNCTLDSRGRNKTVTYSDRYTGSVYKTTYKRSKTKCIVTETKDGSVTSKNVYTLKNGRDQSCKSYDGAGKLTSTTKYAYTKDGALRSIATKNPSGKTIHTDTYTYKKKQLSKRVIKDSRYGNTSTYTTLYSYNRKGWVTKMQETTLDKNGNKSVTTDTYKYNRNGTEKQHRYTYKQDDSSYSTTYNYTKYDKMKHCTEYTKVDAGTGINTTTEYYKESYVYDSKGNMKENISRGKEDGKWVNIQRETFAGYKKITY